MEPKDPSSQDIEPVRPLYQLLLAIGLAGAVLVLSFFGAIWLYHHAKVWRAHYLIRQAQDLLNKKETAEAESNMNAAFYLEPFDPEVLRQNGAYNLSVRKPRALGFYHRLASLPGASRSDTRDALRAFISFGDLKSAEELAQVLIAKSPEAEDYALQAQVYWRARAGTEAISFMRQALSLDPKNSDYRLLLAEMLSAMPVKEEQVEAVNLLHDLAQAQDTNGLKALEVLARYPRLDLNTGHWTLEQLRQHPLLDDDGRFAAWELEKRVGPRDPQTVMREAVDFFSSTDLTRKGEAARWLYNQGQPEMALELAKPPDSGANEVLFLVRLDALAYLKNWAEVQSELNDDKAPISQPLLFLYRAQAAMELGDPATSASDWNQAREAAATDTGVLDYMAKFAVLRGQYDEAKKTYAEMAHLPDQAQEGYTGLLQVEAKHGTTDEVLDTLKQMMTDFPFLPEPKNDWAYLSLLANKNVDEAWKMAQTLVQEHQEVLAYRTTLALGFLRKNDPAGAENVYEGLQIDWSTAPQSGKLIFAIMLGANGKREQAEAFVHILDRSQLRAEELALLDAYLPGA